MLLEALLHAQRPAHTPIDLLTSPLAGTVGSHHHYQPLLHKMRRGLPLSIYAVGSSVVAAYGGCTVPSTLNPGCKDSVALPMTQWSSGWARTFFDQLNASYPHPENALYNLGMGGGSILPVLLACPSSGFLEAAPDIVIFEPSTTEDSEGATYERFVRSLLVRHHPPLVLLFEVGYLLVNKLGHGVDDS